MLYRSGKKAFPASPQTWPGRLRGLNFLESSLGTEPLKIKTQKEWMENLPKKIQYMDFKMVNDSFSMCSRSKMYFLLLSLTLCFWITSFIVRYCVRRDWIYFLSFSIVLFFFSSCSCSSISFKDHKAIFEILIKHISLLLLSPFLYLPFFCCRKHWAHSRGGGKKEAERDKNKWAIVGVRKNGWVDSKRVRTKTLRVFVKTSYPW